MLISLIGVFDEGVISKRPTNPRRHEIRLFSEIRGKVSPQLEFSKWPLTLYCMSTTLRPIRLAVLAKAVKNKAPRRVSNDTTSWIKRV